MQISDEVPIQTTRIEFLFLSRQVSPNAKRLLKQNSSAEDVQNLIVYQNIVNFASVNVQSKFSIFAWIQTGHLLLKSYWE